MLLVKDLALAFKNSGRIGLDGVSFSLPSHGLFLLYGESGSGKSTLLSIIGSLEKPDEGEVLFEGTDVLSLKGKALRDYRRDTVGFCFASSDLVPYLTVRENIMAYCLCDNPQGVYEKCGIADLLDSKASTLSSGQAIRVSLARTILKGSRLFLIDEPTGALDEENAKAVFSLLREIARTALVIVASHDVSLIKGYCDGYLSLEKGKVVSLDAPKDEGETSLASISNRTSNKEQRKFKALSFFKRTLAGMSHSPVRLLSSLALVAISFLLLIPTLSAFMDDVPTHSGTILAGEGDRLVGVVSLEQPNYYEVDPADRPEGAAIAYSTMVGFSFFSPASQDYPSGTICPFDQMFGSSEASLSSFGEAASFLELEAGEVPSSGEVAISLSLFSYYVRNGFEDGNITLFPGSFDAASFLSSTPILHLNLGYSVIEVTVSAIYDDGYGEELAELSALESLDDSKTGALSLFLAKCPALSLFASKDVLEEALSPEVPSTGFALRGSFLKASYEGHEWGFGGQVLPLESSINQGFFPFAGEDGYALPYQAFASFFGEEQLRLPQGWNLSFGDLVLGDDFSELRETAATLSVEELLSSSYDLLRRIPACLYVMENGVPDEGKEEIRSAISAFFPSVDLEDEGVLEVAYALALAGLLQERGSGIVSEVAPSYFYENPYGPNGSSLCQKGVKEVFSSFKVPTVDFVLTNASGSSSVFSAPVVAIGCNDFASDEDGFLDLPLACGGHYYDDLYLSSSSRLLPSSFLSSGAYFQGRDGERLLGQSLDGRPGVYTAVSLGTSAYLAFTQTIVIFRYVFLAVAVLMLLLSAFTLANFQSASLAMSCQEDAVSLALGGSYSLLGVRSLFQLLLVCLPSYVLGLGLAYGAAFALNSYFAGIYGAFLPYLAFFPLPLFISFFVPLLFLSAISVFPLLRKKKAIAERLRSSFY